MLGQRSQLLLMAQRNQHNVKLEHGKRTKANSLRIDGSGPGSPRPGRMVTYEEPNSD